MNLGTKTRKSDTRLPFFKCVYVANRMSLKPPTISGVGIMCVCMCALTCMRSTVSNKSQVIQAYWEYSSKMIPIFAILITGTQLLQDRITTFNVVSILSLNLRHLNSVCVQHCGYQYHGSDSVRFSWSLHFLFQLHY